MMLPSWELLKEKGSDIDWEDLLLKYRFQITLLLIGVILIGLGLWVIKREDLSSTKIEVLESSTESENANSGKIVIEVSGAVETPGVFELISGARVEDALIAAGGISADADRQWIEKALNRAAKISDGQKIYIPRVGEQTNGASANNLGGYQNISSSQGSGFENLINVNTASGKELESLWGIGPVTAQNIIEQRPYSSIEELSEKGILKTNVYETNKEKLTVY
jgi:competence protein ComEA